ncbi:MAG: acetamidase, partial [Candidatus Neomarinimicrobiota bacterium]|nr:acetamidase [Candidatus Neomarinimicrobiota bacterium]
MKYYIFIFLLFIFYSCSKETGINPDYVLSAEQKHNKFSSASPPVIRVPSGSVIKVDTHEASDGQLHRDANID